MAHARGPAMTPPGGSPAPASAIDQRYVTTRDGTRIGYQVSGEGPCIVLANGLGGTHVAYRPVFHALRDYKLICWDYRGLYTSAAPGDPRANTVEHQVSDLVEILAQEGVEDVVVVGWSMGVQVALETVKHHRARVRGVFAICGTYGHPFRTVMGSRMIGRTIPMLVKLVRAQAPLAKLATKRIAGSYALINAMKRAGMVASTVDMDIFREVAAGFQEIDWVIYSDLLSRLDEHDAEAVLPTVDVPFTIVTGDKDLLTPPAMGEHIHRTISGSRLVVVEGGTHYTPVEYPAIVLDELGRLLDRVPGWRRR